VTEEIQARPPARPTPMRQIRLAMEELSFPLAAPLGSKPFRNGGTDDANDPPVRPQFSRRRHDRFLQARDGRTAAVEGRRRCRNPR
jgi:hypothetical protein